MRNYVYGCRPPIENAHLVQEQFRISHSYYCRLIEIERERRSVIDRLYRQKSPTELGTYEKTAKVARAAAEAVRLARSTGGEMLEPDDEEKKEKREIFQALKETLAKARESENEARQAWYDAKKKVTAKYRMRLRWCDRGAYARSKRVYNDYGEVVDPKFLPMAWLPSGTREKMDESAERAAKMAAKKGTLPYFPRCDEWNGVVAVRLKGDSGIAGKKGLSPENALRDEDANFRIRIVDSETWQMLQKRSALEGGGRRDNDSLVNPERAIIRNGKNAGQPRPPLPQANTNSKHAQKRHLAIVRLRIGSDGLEKRAPIWAAWPVIIHRPLPENASIKWAQIHMRKIGPRTEWQLLITVDDDVSCARQEGPRLAVNLGWRNLQNGNVRVAYAIGSDGFEEEVRVPFEKPARKHEANPGYANGIAKVDSLRSTRDDNLVALKKDLKEWIDERDSLPKWFTDATKNIEDWRSPKRVARLVREWRTRRFEGDTRLYEALVAWVKHDRHLWFWEADYREKLLRMRRDYYRAIVSRWLKRGYAEVVLANMDLRDFAELPEPEEGAKTKDSVQRRTRFLAAPSELDAAIKNACSKNGVKYTKVKAIFKTQTCNACGIVFAFAARQFLRHTCECGAEWDQDANHCRNLLASGKVMKDVADPLSPVGDDAENSSNQERQGRWQKRRSKKQSQSSESTSKVA